MALVLNAEVVAILKGGVAGAGNPTAGADSNYRFVTLKLTDALGNQATLNFQSTDHSDVDALGSTCTLTIA